MLVGHSCALQELRETIDLIGPSQACVLILGESGTGKELAARSIHEASGRSGPFVAVNCGALAGGLIESELYGHERGAFTGAHAARDGRVRQADGGTLFLDEIGDMPLEAQVRLLRVLEERRVEPLGSHGSVAVDIRVLAATHRDLRSLVAKGLFREDLFFRLDVLSLQLPALRHHHEDILEIAEAFLQRYASGRELHFSPEACWALERYAWPGNVRELRNVVERASVLCREGVVEPSHLRLPHALASRVRDTAAKDSLVLPPVPYGLSFREAKAFVLEAFERPFVLGRFDACGRNVSRTAQSLSMHRQSLQQKLRCLGHRTNGEMP